MKKIVGLLLALLLGSVLFAEATALQVKEEEWGVEISNLDENGKVICKGDLILNNERNVIIILKKNNEVFNLKSFFQEISSGSTKVEPSVNLVFSMNQGVFTQLSEKTKRRRENFLSDRYLSYTVVGSLGKYDSILFIPMEKEIKNSKATTDGKDMTYRLEYDSGVKSKYAMLASRKAKKDELQTIVNDKDTYKNESFAYRLDKTGDTVIACYLGNSVDNLVIPEKIDGIPVGRIYSMQSLSDVTFKTVTIPKTVKTIDDDAFSDCGIEALIFANDSQLEKIGTNAFRSNKISDLNLPRKELSIYMDAFSDNNIKKVSVYKDWSFTYHTVFGRFNIDDCIKQKDNAFIKSDVLEEVTFEEGCNIISPHIFANCKNLKKLNIPSTMKKFGACAFLNCTSLSEITFAGTPIAEVENYEELARRTQDFIMKYDYEGDIMQQMRAKPVDAVFAPFAAGLAAGIAVMTDPYSATASFGECPIGLKTKRILLQMGLPENAF